MIKPKTENLSASGGAVGGAVGGAAVGAGGGDGVQQPVIQNFTIHQAGVLGSLVAFDEEVSSWEVYEEMLQQYFLANRVTEMDQKRAILLTTVGSKHVKLLWDIFAPDRPATKSFEALCEALCNHFKESTIEIQFSRRRQGASESLKDFLLDLRNLSRNCNYPNVEEQLRDVFVFCIQDANIQQKLLATKELNLAKAFGIACSMASVASKSKELRVNPGLEMFSAPATVNAVQSLGSACYRCGGTDNQPSACSFLTRECYRCYQKGHRASHCPNKDQSTESSSHKPTGEGKKTEPTAKKIRSR